MDTTTFPAATPSWSGDPIRRPLYNPVTGLFNTRRLHHEIFIQGWTVTEFALGLGCGRTSVYQALGGTAVRNKTARAIIEGLHRREPRPHLQEEP